MEKHIIDANRKTINAVCSQAVKLLMGKRAINDVVIVVNAAGLKGGAEGNKKIYFKSSGNSERVRSAKLNDLINRNPERVIEHAIVGRLPNNRDGRLMMQRLRIYAGSER